MYSLAVLLMTAISMECGYPASSIRERIYCNAPGQGGEPMAGILLSTGAANSEGTLGGLVDQARAFTGHLRRAWDLARLCSNDPGCSHHAADDTYDDRSLEGAACHNCLYVAEPSCERFNSFLDRTLVAPTLADEALAFFVERP